MISHTYNMLFTLLTLPVKWLAVKTAYEMWHDPCNWSVWGLNYDYSDEDEKERRQLIDQVFELQNTLDGLIADNLITYLFIQFEWH